MHTAGIHPDSINIDRSCALSDIEKTIAKKNFKITGDNVRSEEIESVNIENDNENDLTQNQCSSEEPSSKKTWKQYGFVSKMDVIDQVEDENVLAEVAFHNRIDKSMATRWLQKKKEIIVGASSQQQNFFKKNQKRFVQLYQKFDLTQSKRIKVSFSWLYAKVNIIHKESNRC